MKQHTIATFFFLQHQEGEDASLVPHAPTSLLTFVKVISVSSLCFEIEILKDFVNFVLKLNMCVCCRLSCWPYFGVRIHRVITAGSNL